MVTKSLATTTLIEPHYYVGPRHADGCSRHGIRTDWEAVKRDVMTRAVTAKFTQHPDLRAALR